MNARRNQVYNALFECKDSVITRLCPDRAISIEELDVELSEKNMPVYLCGDGYNITEKGFKQTTICDVPYRMRLASAYSVALCAINAFNNGEIMSDALLVPIYLRPSQAERERQERLSKEIN